MINILEKTFQVRSQNVGTDQTLWEPSDKIMQTLCASWVGTSPIIDFTAFIYTHTWQAHEDMLEAPNTYTFKWI